MIDFSNVKPLPKKWYVKDTRFLTDEEKAHLSKAEIISGEYGLRVLFTTVDDTNFEVTLSNDSTLKVGDSLNLDTVKVIILCHEDDVNTYVIRISE